jgi:hypothetical protein
MSVHDPGATSFLTGGCARRKLRTATRSSSLMSPNGISGQIDAVPSGRTAFRIMRASCPSL